MVLGEFRLGPFIWFSARTSVIEPEKDLHLQGSDTRPQEEGPSGSVKGCIREPT